MDCWTQPSGGSLCCSGWIQEGMLEDFQWRTEMGKKTLGCGHFCIRFISWRGRTTDAHLLARAPMIPIPLLPAWKSLPRRLGKGLRKRIHFGF